MAKAIINAGACGFVTVVTTKMDGDICKITLEGGCKAIQLLGAELTEVNPYKEISFRRSVPKTIEAGIKYCTHAACPVPVGIIKSIEVEAKLNLPVESTITFVPEDDQ